MGGWQQQQQQNQAGAQNYNFSGQQGLRQPPRTTNKTTPTGTPIHQAKSPTQCNYVQYYHNTTTT